MLYRLILPLLMHYASAASRFFAFSLAPPLQSSPWWFDVPDAATQHPNRQELRSTSSLVSSTTLPHPSASLKTTLSKTMLALGTAGTSAVGGAGQRPFVLHSIEAYLSSAWPRSTRALYRTYRDIKMSEHSEAATRKASFVLGDFRPVASGAFGTTKTEEDVLEEHSKTKIPLNARLAQSVEELFASVRSVQTREDESSRDRFVLFRSASTNKWCRRRTTAAFGEELEEQRRMEEAAFSRNVSKWEAQTRAIDLHTRYEALMLELKPYGLDKAAPVDEAVMRAETAKTLRSYAPPSVAVHAEALRRRDTALAFNPDPSHVPMSHTRTWYRQPVVTNATRKALTQRLALTSAASHDYALDYLQGVDVRVDSRTPHEIVEANKLAQRMGLSALSQLRQHTEEADGQPEAEATAINCPTHSDAARNPSLGFADAHASLGLTKQAAKTSAKRHVFTDTDFEPPALFDPTLVTAFKHESAHDRFCRNAHQRAVLAYTRETLLRERQGLDRAYRHQPKDGCTVDYTRVLDDEDNFVVGQQQQHEENAPTAPRNSPSTTTDEPRLRGSASLTPGMPYRSEPADPGCNKRWGTPHVLTGRRSTSPTLPLHLQSSLHQHGNGSAEPHGVHACGEDAHALSPTAIHQYITTNYVVPRPPRKRAAIGGAAIVAAHSDYGQGLLSARAVMNAAPVFTREGIERSLNNTATGRMTKPALKVASRDGGLGEYLTWGNRVPLRPTHRAKERPARLHM